MLRAIPPSLRRYVLAGLAVGLTTLVIQVEPFQSIAFGLFLFTAVMTSWFLGFRAGLFGAALGLLALDYFTIPPLYSFTVSYVQDGVRLLTFALTVVTTNMVLMHAGNGTREADRAAVDAYQIYAWHTLYRELLESLRGYAAVVLLDREGTVACWNEEAERLTGFAAADICGRPFDALFAPGELAGRPPSDALRAQRCLVCKDGSRRHVGLTVSPLSGVSVPISTTSAGPGGHNAADEPGAFLVLLHHAGLA
jgi:PAS domain S-box-containing protein